MNGDFSDGLVDHSLLDEDAYPSSTIEDRFPHRYINTHSKQIVQSGLNCSSIFADGGSDTFAVVLSDGSVSVIDKSTFKVLNSYSIHDQEVTDIKFSPSDSNVIFSTSLDGFIKVWDRRSEHIEKIIESDADDKKPLTCCDISPNKRLLCAGSELIQEDSFLLFWDLRHTKLLGGYWESHSDDVCSVKFNPENSTVMASSGFDGLINVFDTSKGSEDDALTYCLNAEDSVTGFSWRDSNKKTNILAYTDVHSIQLWDIEESAPSCTFNRKVITKALHRKVVGECHPVVMPYSFDKNPIILAASGLENPNKESCLRTLKINEKDSLLEPHGLLVIDQKKPYSITQGAIYQPDSKDIITIHEDGLVSMWKMKELKGDKLVMKPSKNKNKGKIKPY